VGKGWTFAYYEPPADPQKPSLDRIIRLSNPHLLRSAMVDPWEDTKVTLIEASRSLAQWLLPAPDEFSDDLLLVPVRADPLMGQVVSLGEAKFASATPGGGTGDGHEVLDDFAFSIGGMKFQARQVGKTKGTGVNYLGDNVKNDYKQKKTQLMKAALGAMHPVRAKYLSEYYKDEPENKGGIPRQIQTLASFFAMHADMPSIPLTQVQSHAYSGLLSITQRANLAWKLSLNFGRFDGDTLTGKIKGVLEGSD
jgi:hypothetical protein